MYTMFSQLCSDNLGKKCWDTLGLYIKIGPPFPPYNVDRGHIVIRVAGPLNIDWWGVGRNMVPRRVQATCTTLFEIDLVKNTRMIMKTKSKIRKVSQHVFSKIV